MEVNKKNILWADDEIESLKPHIMFLEDKGYNVIAVNSGEDAIDVCSNKKIDVLLIDEMMTGLDGLSTVSIIKNKYIDIPIIMVTKNEEEWLMEEVIGVKIEDFLTKPVNPSQILMACKKVLDKKDISTKKTIREFIDFFNSVNNLKIDDIKDWISIYSKICDWSIELDNIDDANIQNMFFEQRELLNSQFSKFIVENYINLINDESAVFSNKVFDNFLHPIINNNQKLIFIIIDCLRLDQWKQISQFLSDSFRIVEDHHISVIPTATPFARNAIFSGLFPSEIKENYPEIWNRMYSEKKLNHYEDVFFKKLLEKKHINKSFHYSKISDYNEGEKFLNKLNDYKNIDILSIVVNFVDILGHSRSESNVLKELIPNESAYRKSIVNWFEKSWLKNAMNIFNEWDADIVITADHGNTQVKKPIIVKADHSASLGLRYKYGRNLNIKNQDVLKIENSIDYKLPSFDMNTQYVISKNNNFFVYKNDYHKYVNMFKNTFQHGGITMEEMIVPVAHLKSK